MASNLRYLLEALRGGGTTVFKRGKEVSHAYGPSSKPKDEKSRMGTGKVLNVNERKMLDEV